MTEPASGVDNSSTARRIPLGGDVLERLAAALERAFTFDALRQLVSLELVEGQSLDLDAIVSVQGRNRHDICRDLVLWALHDERVGLHGLLAAALRSNPANPDLLALQQDWAGAVFVPPACPYPGMKPFTTAERGRFYGREAEIAQAIDRLRRHPFLAVIGSSGSGKSSLLAAGILPALAASPYFAGKRWAVHSLRPGATPFDALAATLDLDPADGAPRQPPNPDGDVLTLLVLDQYEEIFTTAGAAQRARCEQALLQLLAAPGFYLVIAARADFYANLMASPLWEQIRNHRLEITPPRGEALRQAIELPGRAVGVELEPALVERLLADAGEEPGVLPYVQETLVMLWAHAGRLRIGLNAYTDLVGDKSGRSGLQVALAEHAEHVYGDVLANDGERAAARRILLRLVQFGEGRPDTRRQQTVGELSNGSGRGSGKESGADPVFDAVLAALTANRLVTVSDEARRVDLSHEALIRGWPRLREWIGQRRTAELTRRRLEDKASERQRLRQGSEAGGLLDAVELAEAEAWVNGPDAAELGVSDPLATLVADSRRALDAALREKEQAAERLRKRSQVLAVALAAALVAVAVAVWFYFNAQAEASNARAASATAQREAQNARAAEAVAQANAQEAANQQAIAEARRAVAEAEQRRSEASRWAAQSSLELDQAQPNVRKALQYAQSAVQATLVADGYVSSAADRALHDALIEAQGPGPGMTFANQSFSSVSFAPDSRNIVLVSGNSKVALLLDIYARKVIRIFLGHEANVRSAQFSPDAKTIVTAGDDQTIRLWDADTGEEVFVLLGHADRVYDAAFSPDGKWIVSAGGDGTVRLWDAAAGREIRRLLGHTNSVYSARFSPDGSKVVSAGADGTVRIWDVATGAQVGVRTVGAANRKAATAVNFATFSPDGSSIAAVTGRFTLGSGEFNGYIWPVAAAGQPVVLNGHIRAVRSAAYSQDGQKLATVSDDGTARIWDVHTGKQLRQFELYGDRGSIYLADVAFAAGDEDLVVVGDNGSISLLEPDIGELLFQARTAERRIKLHEEEATPVPSPGDAPAHAAR